MQLAPFGFRLLIIWEVTSASRATGGRTTLGEQDWAGVVGRWDGTDGSAEEDDGKGREGQSFGFHSGLPPLSTRPDPDPDPDLTLPDLSPAQAPVGL